MAAQVSTHSTVGTSDNKPAAAGSRLLRRALLGNAIFSTLSGLTFIFASSAIASFLGLEYSALIAFTGIDLLIFGAIVYKVATATPINRMAAYTIIGLDLLWVVGSAVLIFMPLVALTTGGKWAVAIVADIVLCFAVLQYVGVKRYQG